MVPAPAKIFEILADTIVEAHEGALFWIRPQFPPPRSNSHGQACPLGVAACREACIAGGEVLASSQMGAE